jgi:hypothetical protein
VSDDPKVKWEQAVPYGIERDASGGAWHAGHVADILTLDKSGILAASQMGGVWLITDSKTAIPLGDDWDAPDVRCLALGPDGPRHVYAGGGRPARVGEHCVVSWAPKRFDVFAVADDGTLWHRWRNDSEWSAWESLGGDLVGSPVGVAWAADRLDLFGVGSDGALWHQWWDGSNWGTWESLGGELVGTPAAVAWAANRLDVFAIRADGALWHMWWDGSSWGTWESLGGKLVGSPAAVAWAANRLDVFAVGGDGAVWHRWWDGSGWGTWKSLGGTFMGSPTVVSWSANHLDVFANGMNGILCHKRWSGTAWHPSGTSWRELCAGAVDSPRAVCDAPDRTDVFVLDANGYLKYQSWDGSDWQIFCSPLAEMGTVGALRETDSGNPLGLLKWVPVQFPAEAGVINRIGILPVSRRIVAATETGVWWSTIPAAPSAGRSYDWRAATNLQPGAYSDLAVGPDESIVVAASPRFPGDSPSGLFRGVWSFENLVMTTCTIAGADAAKMNRTSVASCASHPDTMYAISAKLTPGGAADDGWIYAVLKSSDGGSLWARLITSAQALDEGPAKAPLESSSPDMAGGQGDWNNCIAVSPVDKSVVAVGWRNGPWISTDGGATWLRHHSDKDNKHLHADLHALRFDQNDATGRRLYVGSDGGVIVTSDLGKTFTSDFNELLNNLQFQGQPTRMFPGSTSASYQAAGLIAGGLQDNGVVFARAGSGDPWHELIGGDGMCAQFIATGQVIYTSNDDGLARYSHAKDGTVTTGAVIPVTVTKPGGPGAAGLQPLIVQLVNAPKWHNPAGELMYGLGATAADLYGLFAHSNGTDLHWEYLTTAPGGAGTTIEAMGSATGSAITIGTSEGRLFGHNMESGFNVEQRMLQRAAPAGTITRIVVVSDELQLAVHNVGALGYVLRSDGRGWRPLIGGLPTDTFYSLELDWTVSPALLFAATDRAVYVSRDLGITWRRASLGLPKRPHCADLRFVTEPGGKRIMYLTTYGRSLWRAVIL